MVFSSRGQGGREKSLMSSREGYLKHQVALPKFASIHKIPSMNLKKLLYDEHYHWKIYIAFVIVSIFLLLGRIVVTKSTVGGDAVLYYITARSILMDGDLDFQNEFHHFYNEVSPFTGNRKINYIPPPNSKTGKVPNKYPVGTSLLILPFMLVARLVSPICSLMGWDIAREGYGLLYQFFAGIASIFYAFLALLLIYKKGKSEFSSVSALIGLLLIWLATPLIYYMTMESIMSHSFSMAMVTFFLYLWLKKREKYSPKDLILLGLLGGVMSIVRYQDALFLIIPLLDIAMSKKPLLYKLRSFVIVAFFFLIGTLPQLYTNYVLYGSPFTYTYGREGFPYWKSPKFLYSLFSTQSGLLLWSPVIAFSLLGSVIIARKWKRLGLLIIFGFLIQLYLVSSWWAVFQGDSFGNRMLLNSTFIFAFWLIAFIDKLLIRGRRILYLILSISLLLIISNAILACLYCFRIIGNPY
jgi:hypothetical protein